MNNSAPATEYVEVPAVGESPVSPPPVVKQLNQLCRHEFGDPYELFENRFLCRKGGMLLVGPTGVGKSSFLLQCTTLWGRGKPAFGITPTMPLRILILQAENDEEDLSEMRDGVFNGLKLSKEDRDYACENVLVATESARTSSGFFEQVVKPLLEAHRPDLLVIDPALAYLGGDASNQKDVGTFLRNCLNPLLAEYNCGCVVVHHTNKPPSGKEKSGWKAGDFAYLGSGSAEWANWADRKSVV